jgi:hypothetical protein
VKKSLLGCIISFIAGYAFFAMRDDDSSSSRRPTEVFPSGREASARPTDMVDAYHDLMMDDEQKFQMALDQANRLSDLLGLAEKACDQSVKGIAITQSSFKLIIDKIARLFPKEALDYYESCPTDAIMNMDVYRDILSKWAELDFTACMAYLQNKPDIFDWDFARNWGTFADRRFKTNPQDCIDVFQGFSEDMQRWLITESNMEADLQEALLPLIKDQVLMAKVKDDLAKNKAVVELTHKKMLDEVDAAWQKEAVAREPSQIEQWKKAWHKECPAPEVMVSAIRSLPEREDRLYLLKWITKARRVSLDSEYEPPEEWMERVSTVLRDVGEIPDSLPELPDGDDQPYRKLLSEWLPQQSPTMQRAWSEAVVRFQEPAQSLAWAETLATESLRHDMRDLAWERWVATSAREAAPALMKQATPDELEIHLPDAVYGWAVWDYAAAKQWLDAQPDSPAKTQALEKIRGQ